MKGLVSTTEEITEPPQIVQQLTQGATGQAGPIWHRCLYPEEPKLSTAPGSREGLSPKDAGRTSKTLGALKERRGKEICTVVHLYTGYICVLVGNQGLSALFIYGSGYEESYM